MTLAVPSSHARAVPRPVAAAPGDDGMRRSLGGRAVEVMYAALGCRRRWRLGRVLLALAQRLEGGPHYSITARRLMLEHHGVSIGSYSRSGCFDPAHFDPGVTFGRYCSVARGVRYFPRNHPLDRLSTHALFYDRRLGLVADDRLDDRGPKLAVGGDVWIGTGVLITGGCREIGDGAVVGAGAVVTRDVPPFAVVGGNPAKVIRYRFDERTRDRLLAARWWDRPLSAVAAHLDDLDSPVDDLPDDHPLLNPLPRGEEGGPG